MNQLQATVCQRVLPAFTIALLAVAMASTSGVSAPADTFVPVDLSPADESGKNLRLMNDTDLNPCSSPQELIVAQRTPEEEQACYQGCVNRCWLRWMNRGHAGDRFGRYQQYIKCKNSCMWSCG